MSEDLQLQRQPKHTVEVIDQMHEEVFALISAWIDRGISPADCAVFLTGTSHMLLMQLTDCKLSEVIEALTEQWNKHGGKL